MVVLRTLLAVLLIWAVLPDTIAGAGANAGSGSIAGTQAEAAPTGGVETAAALEEYRHDCDGDGTASALCGASMLLQPVIGPAGPAEAWLDALRYEPATAPVTGPRQGLLDPPRT